MPENKSSSIKTWSRHRFQANHDDPRPVIFPPPGPYWITGYAGDDSYAIVVAYLPAGDAVTDYWPEAAQIETEERADIIYTDRFQKPEWYEAA